MKIVVDENIPLAREFFSTLGDVVTLPGRSLSAADVRDADALIVRSVTPVNESLLAGTPVKFVGSCTIGFDHFDLSYLQQNDITYTNAPGCNANSVVEWVLSVLASLGIDWSQKTVGIIGCGNVGGRLDKTLRALGVETCCYDPFLSTVNQHELVDLETVLCADIISLHTPLTVDGQYPTFHLLDDKRLSALKAGTLLLNSGRGAVIDNQALLNRLCERNDIQVVLDVWEPEPDISVDLLKQVTLGSAHIAGYSFDGKVAGTVLIYEALCRFMQQEPVLTHQAFEQVREHKPHTLSGPTAISVVQQAILHAYDMREDDRLLRDLGKNATKTMATGFDQLRKQYRKRREFFCHDVALPDDLDCTEKVQARHWLQVLGFNAE